MVNDLDYVVIKVPFSKKYYSRIGKKIFALMYFTMKIVWHVHVSNENLKIYGFIVGNRLK